MKLNVIIPSYNSGSTIGDTIESVLACDGFDDLQADITVVDSSDSGSDTTSEIISGYGDRVRFIKLDERAYPGKARNVGVKETSGDIICFVDSDARVESGWLRSIRDYLGEHTGVSAVGGPVLNGNPGDGASLIAHWCEFSGYGKGAPEGLRRVQPTVNVAIRREVFEKCGPFLEDQFGNEDVLLFQNMKKMGYELHFNREQIVHHQNKTDLEAIYKHQYTLGESTGRARVEFDLPGSFLTRPGWGWLVPFIKTKFIGWRILTQEPGEIGAYIFKWPYVVRAMVHFSRGFRDGVDAAKEMKS